METCSRPKIPAAEMLDVVRNTVEALKDGSSMVNIRPIRDAINDLIERTGALIALDKKGDFCKGVSSIVKKCSNRKLYEAISMHTKLHRATFQLKPLLAQSSAEVDWNQICELIHRIRFFCDINPERAEYVHRHARLADASATAEHISNLRDLLEQEGLLQTAIPSDAQKLLAISKAKLNKAKQSGSVDVASLKDPLTWEGVITFWTACIATLRIAIRHREYFKD